MLVNINKQICNKENYHLKQGGKPPGVNFPYVKNRGTRYTRILNEEQKKDFGTILLEDLKIL